MVHTRRKRRAGQSARPARSRSLPAQSRCQPASKQRTQLGRPHLARRPQRQPCFVSCEAADSDAGPPSFGLSGCAGNSGRCVSSVRANAYSVQWCADSAGLCRWTKVSDCTSQPTEGTVSHSFVHRKTMRSSTWSPQSKRLKVCVLVYAGRRISAHSCSADWLLQEKKQPSIRGSECRPRHQLPKLRRHTARKVYSSSTLWSLRKPLAS